MTKTFSEKLDAWRTNNDIGQCIVENYKEAHLLIKKDMKNIFKMIIPKGESVCEQQDNLENPLGIF